MARWLVCSVGACLALALAACSTAPEPWEHIVGATHPLSGQIYRGKGSERVREAVLIADAADADFILIGERHDNRDHHRLQARIVSALERDPRRPRALAFEMLSTDRQLAIVEYLDGHPGDAAGLGAALDGRTAGWPDWGLYAAIAQAALANGAQIVAADLDAAQQRAVFEQGPYALRSSFVQRTGLNRDVPGALAGNLRDELSAADCGEPPAQTLAGMSWVQRARDAMMADRLAAASGKAGGILIAGNGHVRKDRGVPWYLARLEPEARIVSIGLIEVQDEVRRPPADLPYDYVWFTPRVDDQDPCATHETDLERLRGSG
jgi:uncharacterized iron-regulated protein